MPRLKEREQPFAGMCRLLRGYGVTAPKAAIVLDVSRPTAKKRLDAPELLTLGELVRLSRSFNIPMEEIRDNVVMR